MIGKQQGDWSIQEIARLAGTSSRTLRHYHDIGLLRPTRTGSNGYRYYDRDALVRLQRILLLKDLGLGLSAIAEVLQNETDAPRALRSHLAWLREEQNALARRTRAVEMTIEMMEGGGELMAEDMLSGFDHRSYAAEVEERWGAEAASASDAWWSSKSTEEKERFTQLHRDIARDYAAARAAGEVAAGERVQQIVSRHIEWLNLSAPVTGARVTRQRLLGYGDMYVADPRFAANYGGAVGAEFVRDAFAAYTGDALADDPVTGS